MHVSASLCIQGSGFSEVIASLEAELRSMRLAHVEVIQDNKGCYNQIRAKDKELDAAAVQLEHARAVLVENKASSESHGEALRMRCHVSLQGRGCSSCAARARARCPGREQGKLGKHAEPSSQSQLPMEQMPCLATRNWMPQLHSCSIPLGWSNGRLVHGEALEVAVMPVKGSLAYLRRRIQIKSAGSSMMAAARLKPARCNTMNLLQICCG